MRNYFNYFTEIEERFQQRRGTLLMLSTLDWVLIETWREAGLPLEVVLRGIDTAFDHFETRRQRSEASGKGRLRRVNGLAWCAQAVLESTEQAARASLADPAGPTNPSTGESPAIQTGFEPDRISRFLHTNADLLAAISLPEPAATVLRPILSQTTIRLRTLAADRDPNPAISTSPRSIVISTEGDATRHRSGETCGSSATKPPAPPPTTASVISTEGEAQRSQSGETCSSPATKPNPQLSLEELDRALTSLEERLVAALQTATPEPDLLALREQAASELAPYKSRMGAVQIRQLQQQFLQKRLLEQHRIPRLSLFYMGMA